MAPDRISLRRGTSRRVFLHGALVGAAATALAACSQAAPASPTAAPAAASQAATPTSAPAAAPTTAPATKPTTAATAASQPTTQANTSSGAVPEATMNPSAAKGKTLHLLAWNLYKAEGMKTWVPKFEQEVGGKVVFDLVASTELASKQIVSLSGRTGEYDLTTSDEPYIPAYSPYLLELTPLIKRDKFPVDDWVPIMWDAGNYQGKVFAIPFDSNVEILFYRKDLLDAKGLKVPTKWSELYDDAMKTQERDKELWGQLLVTKRDDQTGINLWTYLECWGNEIFDQSNKVAFQNDQGYAAAEFFKKTVDTIAPKGHLGYDGTVLPDNMATGHGVFFYYWSSVTLSIVKDKKQTVADKVGFAPALGEKVPPLSMRGVWSMVIPSDSKNRDAAWEFVKWFSSYQGQLNYTKGGSGNPCRLSVLNSDEFKKTSPAADAIAATIKIAKKRPIYKEYGDIINQMDIWASKLTSGTSTPKETIDGLAAALNDIMKKGGYQKS
jgi:multiple sugar transport system substrate-binding protein